MIWTDGHLYFANQENELWKIEKEGKVVKQFYFPKKEGCTILYEIEIKDLNIGYLSVSIA